VNAIKDKKIDAFFWVGGLPTAAVTDLGATPGVKIKLIDHSDVVDKMNAKYGKLYVTDVIPTKTYPGQDADNKISTVWNILVANEKMTDEIAYAILNIIFDKKADLVAVHREAENFDYKYQIKASSPIPWHPGALKYFADKGVKM
jgi:TRAP transporter TAXI family solute receptor